jgi:hypothetical protein
VFVDVYDEQVAVGLFVWVSCGDTDAVSTVETCVPVGDGFGVGGGGVLPGGHWWVFLFGSDWYDGQVMLGEVEGGGEGVGGWLGCRLVGHGAAVSVC